MDSIEEDPDTLQKIEYCKESNEEGLDLSELEIKIFPIKLFDLTNLKILDLTWNFILEI